MRPGRGPHRRPGAFTGAGAGAVGHRPLLEADFVPSRPAPESPAIAGVSPGALPWVLTEGEAHLRGDGRLDVHLDGLQVIRPDGSRDNPVGSITAVVYCDGVAAGTSGPRALSVPGGDARFRTSLDLPGRCGSATVLVSPTALVGRAYIASATAAPDASDD